MKRNYEAEILQALKERPRNAPELAHDLRSRSHIIGGALLRMEIAGVICWISNVNVWKIEL